MVSLFEQTLKIFTHTDDYTGNQFYSPFNADGKTSGKRSNILIKNIKNIGKLLIIPGAKWFIPFIFGKEYSFVPRNADPWTTYFGLPLKKIAKRQKKFLSKKKIKEIY